MDWTTERIRQLRQRMGWSQCELARRLRVDLVEVSAWESGSGKPLAAEIQTLEFLSLQAEGSAEELASTPLSEILANESGSEQVRFDEVQERFPGDSSRSR